MKVQQINRLFRILGEIQIRYRWGLLVFLILLTVFGMFGLKHAAFVTNHEGWFDSGDAIQIAQDKFEEQFGNNEFIGVLIQADDVFHPEVLSMIRDLGEELIDKVPYADEVSSLMEFETTVGTEDGIEVINPFGDGIPEDPAELKKMRDFVLSRKSVVNKLVSADGTATWLSLSLVEYPEEVEWKAAGDTDPLYQDGDAAVAVITDPKWKSDRYTIKASGLPYTESEERVFFGREMKIRILTSFGLMIFLLIFLLRSFWGVVVPVFTTVAGIAVVFGFMGWLDIGIDSNFVTLPVLLGTALSVGYSIHLVNAFKRLFRESGKRKEAIVRAVEETGWPILFTAVTTMGSVMSFAVTGIAMLRWLGFTCAAVVFMVYLFIMILIPIFMSFGKDKAGEGAFQAGRLPMNTRFEKLGGWVLKHKLPVALAFIAMIIGFAPGISKIKVNIDVFEFMGLKVPYVKRLHDIVHSQLGSYISYNITVRLDEPGAVKDPEVLRKFDKLLTEVGQFDLTKKNEGVPKVFSILDILKDMNQTFHGDDPACYSIPEARELVAQLLFLYELSGGEKTFDWVNKDFTLLRARVEMYSFHADEVVRELERIDALGRELFPDGKVETIGGSVRFAAMNEKIVSGELKSFLAALIVIGMLLGLVFASLKTGLIGMIPNLTPLVVLAGFMGYFGYSLDMMSMTIIPMLLGIAVDDTIHFINQIKLEFEKCGNYTVAVKNSFYVVGKTLTMTTIILAVNFGSYMLSPINGMFRIGLLASMGLISALAADFTMTPIVILLTKPFGKERNPAS